MRKVKKQAILDKLMNKPKFYCLQRDFFANECELFELESKTKREAWDEIEEAIATNTSQEWLLKPNDVRELIKILKRADLD